MIVTTINKRLYNEYGRKTISSWVRKVGKKHGVVLVCEQSESAFFQEKFPSFIVLSFREKDMSLLEELKSIEALSRKSDHFNYSASRFFWKVAATNIALDYVSSKEVHDSLVWLDADTKMVGDFSVFSSNKIIDENFVCSYFGRWDMPMYPETGLIYFNLKKPEAKILIEKWYDLFSEKKVFEFEIWHDAFAFGVLVEGDESCKDLSKSNNINSSHPIMALDKNRNIVHLKGERKQRGVSLKDWLRVLIRK